MALVCSGRGRRTRWQKGEEKWNKKPQEREGKQRTSFLGLASYILSKQPEKKGSTIKIDKKKEYKLKRCGEKKRKRGEQLKENKC